MEKKRGKLTLSGISKRSIENIELSRRQNKKMMKGIFSGKINNVSYILPYNQKNIFKNDLSN